MTGASNMPLAWILSPGSLVAELSAHLGNSQSHCYMEA